MTKKLYLMRHGETLFNQLKRIQGWSDSPLTEKGIAQAKIAGNYFSANQITLDHAYASTSERACDTLEQVTTLPYQRVKGLKEWNFGVFEGESESLNPPHAPGETSYGDFFVPFGGESSQELQERMVNTLTEIMERPDHQEVLAVSHGGSLYLFLQKWLSFPEVKKVQFSNRCILVFSYSDKEFQFLEAINHDFSEL
ncbi:histidine phosphatase family protein [Enterococcus thailandicus]|uniref:histidine phosphatase family protein n=1 Tax=Enterococcus thailandicus TaxID=417368 RepID=UPI0022E6247B|nr:histidine phosphatase family protein [Enterococcus thailandicus]